MMILYITIDEDRYALNTRLRADDDSFKIYPENKNKDVDTSTGSDYIFYIEI